MILQGEPQSQGIVPIVRQAGDLALRQTAGQDHALFETAQLPPGAGFFGGVDYSIERAGGSRKGKGSVLGGLGDLIGGH